MKAQQPAVNRLLTPQELGVHAPLPIDIAREFFNKFVERAIEVTELATKIRYNLPESAVDSWNKLLKCLNEDMALIYAILDKDLLEYPIETLETYFSIIKKCLIETESMVELLSRDINPNLKLH